MALEVTGRLIQLLDLQSGTSARGDWKKQDFILETDEQYPRKISISLWGDRVNDIRAFSMGDLITVGITLESREFNGKWYTDVRSWRIVKAVTATTAAPQPQPQASNGAYAQPQAAPPATEDEFVNQIGEDDLPF
ncbi:MAG: DUF3127 domain-containing protein [Prevotellaceae bacterium]|jgi:hypothetical protein|nr:DUF3127 domain-containing protein [Prevotellaceae bacterium]